MGNLPSNWKLVLNNRWLTRTLNNSGNFEGLLGVCGVGGWGARVRERIVKVRGMGKGEGKRENVKTGALSPSLPLSLGSWCYPSWASVRPAATLRLWEESSSVSTRAPWRWRTYSSPWSVKPNWSARRHRGSWSVRSMDKQRCIWSKERLVHHLMKYIWWSLFNYETSVPCH